jgi:hypothetical protein
MLDRTHQRRKTPSPMMLATVVVGGDSEGKGESSKKHV